MRALDTGILLGLLEGSARARELLRKLRGSELATTEANLLELAYLAAATPPRGRAARLNALEKLRQRLTVLPLDARAVRESTSGIIRQPERLAPTVAAMLGALEAAGCEELYTDDPRAIAGDWGFKVKVVAL
jgi:predicted nucleic acid-binding protein